MDRNRIPRCSDTQIDLRVKSLESDWNVGIFHLSIELVPKAPLQILTTSINRLTVLHRDPSEKFKLKIKKNPIDQKPFIKTCVIKIK